MDTATLPLVDEPAYRTIESAPERTKGTSRLHSLWRGNPDDPTWARPALWGLLLATAVFYLVNLTSNGYANAFYSAAAQAGSSSWKAFFFGSLDGGNSITVDKPPASLWVMALSVRLFGLNSFAILFPEVVMGVASVGVLYATVRRHFGAIAALLAGAVLALTPVAVLMFRFNNPEALLVLLMTLGAWATAKAVDQASPRWMIIVGVFMGLGFLTKTLQVLLVIPGFAVAYLVAANTTVVKRIWHTLLAAGAMVLSAGWWVAIVELIPASARPYIGGSQTNSFLELTFGYNGLGRIDGNESGSVGGGGRAGGWGATGLARMFNSSVGGQISWLLPAALILLAAGFVVRGRRPRTDARRAAYLIWGGWLVVTALTFSLMAGIFHEYYTIALAPAIAALVAMGAVELWEHKESTWARIVLAATMAATGIWCFLLLSQTPTWLPWLRIVVLAAALCASLGLLALDVVHRSAVPVIAGVGVVAALLGPTAYSVATVDKAYSGSIVTAGPTMAGGRGGPGGAPGGAVGGQRGAFGGAGGAVGAGGAGGAGGFAPGGGGTPNGAGGMGGLLNATIPDTAVVATLSADASQYTWVAATVGSQNAAGLQLGTQLPVMAIGGFNGTDPSPTLEQFQAYVAAGRIHYFLAGGLGGMRQNGGADTSSQISTWVAENFPTVSIGGTTFYDLTQPSSGSTDATPTAV